MKKALAITLLILSISSFAQDTISKKLALGVGPTWGTLGWGGNLNLTYSVSKKFNIKLRGIYVPGKNIIIHNPPYYGGIETRPLTDISLSVNYFILGNTNRKCKAALYVGLGLGYLQQITNTSYVYPGNLFSGNNPIGSYLEKDVSKGFAANGTLGAVFKLGPGKIYIEGCFSISFIGSTYSTFTFMNNITSFAIPPTMQVNTYKEDFEPEAFLGFNAGYIIPF